jgi:hypothetical protein
MKFFLVAFVLFASIGAAMGDMDIISGKPQPTYPTYLSLQ